MDPYDFPVTRSPRKELQGPRPPALKVRKDSHKIKKPPVAPQPSQQHQNQQQQYQQSQPRPPVIIYTVSPKVIHTNPSDFMNLVQRLTGSTSSSSSSSSSSAACSTSNPTSYSSSNPFNDYSGAISPAARFATIEKAKSPNENMKQQVQPSGDVGFFEGIEMSQVMERSGNLFHGILSPAPSSLPPISPNFFSPPSDPNMMSFLHDLSPALHGNRSFLEGTFMPSPSTTFLSPRLTASPTPSLDLFNNFNNIFDY
ncbi:nuclear speckle RNA-binding protein B [Ricinus communis]|uniref:Protein MKS1, putative n=1 Tax=Ricinus communis TaxID=3988 RepID=B9SJG7_RICCO|nr:nuclear speckle RNA-binding protein B [Ricinus communis]EEF36212.1 Protein MKS1, putative [Ricinus communis]|eukprot:XP_002526136.1 nuclear speckle RNA-binding protein B [Ricinus communis]